MISTKKCLICNQGKKMKSNLKKLEYERESTTITKQEHFKKTAKERRHD